jgi:uncharacterized membrane protein YhaH (DUF805 family)
MDFVSVEIRRQSALIRPMQALTWLLVFIPLIATTVKHWPNLDWSSTVLSLSAIGIMAMTIEDRLANLLNEAEEINALLRNIVKSPSDPDVVPRDIVQIRRALHLSD